MNPTFVIFGSKGLLGQNIKFELANRFPKSDFLEISRATRISVLEPREIENITDPIIAFYCQGPTDPKLSAETHEKFHVTLPRLWLKKLNASGKLLRFITFGSVHENCPLSQGNNYLTAKKNWFSEIAENKALHFQLHTVYGNPVSPHSFLGEMLKAIRTGRDFEMSEGRQLREYHHVDDIAKKVVDIISEEKNISSQKVLILSHGKPLSLRNLAQGIFEEVKPVSGLKIGALPTHMSEIVENHWAATSEPFSPTYRDSIKGVAQVILKELK